MDNDFNDVTPILPDMQFFGTLFYLDYILKSEMNLLEQSYLYTKSIYCFNLLK